MLDILVFFYFSVLVVAPLSFAAIGLLVTYRQSPAYRIKCRARKFKRV